MRGQEPSSSVSYPTAAHPPEAGGGGFDSFREAVDRVGKILAALTIDETSQFAPTSEIQRPRRHAALPKEGDEGPLLPANSREGGARRICELWVVDDFSGLLLFEGKPVSEPHNALIAIWVRGDTGTQRDDDFLLLPIPELKIVEEGAADAIEV